MSQWEYIGGIPHEVGGGDIPIPVDELRKQRYLGKEKEWIVKYRYNLLNYFNFMKEHYGFDIYEEFKKIDKREPVKKDLIDDRFDILDL